MSDQPAMTVGKRILLRMFGHPKGSLGRLGGLITARMNRQIAAWAIDMLGVRRAAANRELPNLDSSCTTVVIAPESS